MKKIYLLLLFIGSIGNAKVSSNNAVKVSKIEYYQLKTYVLKTEQQEQSTDQFLKEAYLPALKRLGLKNIGVFKPRTIATDTLKKIIVLIPFASMDQFLSLDEKLGKDKNYANAGKTFLTTDYLNPTYVRIESILLKAFEDHPFITPSPLESLRSERVYELRSYESATEPIYKAKVDMFNAGGEINLFKQLGFNAVFYGEVLSGAKMPNLMYMTTFANQESRDAHWKSFSESEEWKKMSNLDCYKNTVSHMDILFLNPTEYSDY